MQNVRKELCFVLFLTDKSDRSSQPSGQIDYGRADGRKRRYVGIYYSSRDVRIFANLFSKFNAIIPAGARNRNNLFLYGILSPL